MRVVAATPAYPPASRVGAWLATHELLRGLVARGHDVVVVQTAVRRRPDYDLDGITVSAMERGRDLDSRVREADVVVSHCGDNGMPALMAGRHDVASVRIAHGHRPDVGHADLVVFNSHALAAATAWDGPAVVCHPPVWPDRHATTPGDHVTLVNLTAAKGVKVAWRCAERLPLVPFLGVQGGYGDQIHPRAANFEVVRTTRDMRGDVWARTRILLMPSEHETWGMVGVEAMCSGIPVIAHPTAGLVESLGDAGTFVDRDDLDGWVAAIERLLYPDRWAEASARALARVGELDPAADVDRFCDAVEALVGVPA